MWSVEAKLQRDGILETMTLAKKAMEASRPSGNTEGEPRMATANAVIRHQHSTQQKTAIPPMQLSPAVSRRMRMPVGACGNAVSEPAHHHHISNAHTQTIDQGKRW